MEKGTHAAAVKISLWPLPILLSVPNYSRTAPPHHRHICSSNHLGTIVENMGPTVICSGNLEVHNSSAAFTPTSQILQMEIAFQLQMGLHPPP